MALIFVVAYLIYTGHSKKIEKLKRGICPECGAINTEAEQIISTKALNSAGCSGVRDIEYHCKGCDYKTIEKSTSRGCGI